MRKLCENFHIFYFQKRIVSAETIRGKKKNWTLGGVWGSNSDILTWNIFEGFFYFGYTFPKNLYDILFISNVFRCYLTPKRKGNMTCMGLWKVKIRGQTEVDMVIQIHRMVLKVICLLKRYLTCFSVRFLNF